MLLRDLCSLVVQLLPRQQPEVQLLNAQQPKAQLLPQLRRHLANVRMEKRVLWALMETADAHRKSLEIHYINLGVEII